MQIRCPNCRKIFFVKDELIPNEGRQLQCGKCFNEWFFVKKLDPKKVELKKVQKNFDDIEISDENNGELLNNKIIKKNDFTERDQKKANNIKKKNINIFKLILVIIISFAALIVIIETFKNQISVFYPDILIILDNLFESLKDIYLFIKDLIK